MISLPLALLFLAGSAAAQETWKLVDAPKVEGGSYDDERFARLALGFRAGQDVDPERLRIGLEAVRATDRFKSVGGHFEDAPGGKIVKLRLDPWPTLKSVHTDIPPELMKLVKPWLQDIRKGTRPGSLAIEAWKKKAEEWLAVWGYPSAKVNVARSYKGDSIAISIDSGTPTLLRHLEITGSIGVVSRESILSDLGCKPGQTIWTSDVQRRAIQRLNRRFARYSYLFAKANFFWNPDSGNLAVDINTGPAVSLKVSGVRLRTGLLKEYLGLPSIDRYGADFLGEAERRLTNKFQAEGRPRIKINLKETPISGKAPERAIQLECSASDAEIMRVSYIKIQGNNELNEADLLRAAKSGYGGFFSKRPKGTPEIIENSLAHTLSHCLSLGYADATVRHEWITENKQSALLITVEEGERQKLKEITFDFETSAQADIEKIRNGLFNYFEASASYTEGAERIDFKPRRKDGITSNMRWESYGNNIDKLIMLAPTPFIKIHIAAIRSVIQQTMASNGVGNPIVNIAVTSDNNNDIVVQFNVPEQIGQRLRRMIIQGADRTRAEFIRSEMRPTPNQDGISFGQPLVMSSITGARASLGTLGIFSSIDVRSMQEVAVGTSDESPSAWMPGDMLFQLKERPLWNFSNSFSYDRSTGYQLGFGAQRINIAGKAKTLDFSVRAGDGTINNSLLRDLFPTGNPERSLDVYSIGFSDPWLSTQPLSRWLANRALLRSDLAYIEERQNSYLIVRHRFVTSLEWRVRDQKSDIRVVRLGYRFENVRIEGLGSEALQNEIMSPGSSLLSVPFIQFIRDTRDHPFDPKRGSIFSLQIETAVQTLGTSTNSSFVKVDFRFGWNFPMGENARFGVTSLALRLGAARPTASSSLELPLSERFLAGGPNTHRGVEPDQLGPFGVVYNRRAGYLFKIMPKHIYDLIKNDDLSSRQYIPIGGQGIALVNLDYRFPLPVWGQWIWGQVFLDSGEIYSRIREYTSTGTSEESLPPFPRWRTSVGIGLVLKLGGFPIKIEYAWDARKLLGKQDYGVYGEYVERTRLKNLLVSAGVQF
jgi:outer membrane protein assembly factor BamA